MRQDIHCWNRIPSVAHARVEMLTLNSAPLPRLREHETCLVYGNGRSYGDVCLNPGQTLLLARGLDRFISFDAQTGRLTCEPGVLLGEILDLVVPMGWFLPVTPGTRLATVGGAIANDVHGKNHHAAGSFGDHVLNLELVRSDGERLRCAPDENADMFAATIGGLGLTGLIARAELQLAPISNAFMITQDRRFRSLDEFWELNSRAEAEWPYTVSWIDCTSSTGRGILFSGAHAPSQAGALPTWRQTRTRFPLDLPVSLINQQSVKAFNFACYHRPRTSGRKVKHYIPYFYPLDSIEWWNRIYGRKGFFQYQCVLPLASAKAGISELLAAVSTSRTGSFLAVLKTFGARSPRGILSFPRPGATLALDFPNLGETTMRLFERLDAIVRESGGALYAAKDARMSGEMFRLSYRDWEKFMAFTDPKFSSGFWRRVTESAGARKL